MLEAARTTQDYGQYDPGYLTDAVTALDAWVLKVLKLSRKRAAKTRKAA